MANAFNWPSKSATVLFRGAWACEDELLETLDSAVGDSRVKHHRKVQVAGLGARRKEGVRQQGDENPEEGKPEQGTPEYYAQTANPNKENRGGGRRCALHMSPGVTNGQVRRSR